jgi:peptide/nickel transport system substrate-binding protein
MFTNYVVLGTIFEGLLEYDPDTFTLRPHIAEEYTVSDDGLEIYFRIREDACFSDGVPVTADDVIFTYETIVNPGVDAASIANYFRDVDRVEKLSEREVKFVMKQVYFKSLEFVSLGGSTGILPKHVYEFEDPTQFNKRISDPVGSGPYVFEQWDVGNQIILRRNENYWWKKPKIGKIVYKFITNDTAAVQAIRSGDIDYMRPLPDQFADLRDDASFTEKTDCLSYWHPGVGYFWIGWNQDRPFFADRRVRLALTHLVDRERIRTYLLKVPEAEIPTGPFYLFGPQSDPNVRPWPYDPETARELLDEAGWVDHDGDGIRDRDGVPFRFRYMIVGGTPLHEQMSKLVKDSFAESGIDVIPDPFEWSVFIQRVQDRQFDAVNMAWGGGLAGDPYQVWHSSQIGSGGSNYVGFNNAEADALMEEARRTLDDSKRNAMFHAFHRIIHYEQPYTFVYTRPEQRFLDRRFENVKIHLLGLDEREWYVPLDKQKYTD